MESLSNVVAAKATKQASCEKHGVYESVNLFRSVWSRCPVCHEIQTKETKEAEERGRLQFERERLQQRLGQAAIPRRFIGRRFDSFNASTEAQAKALATCKQFAADFPEKWSTGNGLVLSGKPGTGKSHLAASIMQELLLSHSVLYVTCMDLIRMIRETWRRDSAESERDVLSNLARIHLLVIDEVGVQYGTESEQTILFDVLDLRYRYQMPSILLTNQDMAGAKHFLGERTWDRMRETSRWVAFDWDSYRPQARKELEAQQ